jgi:hypothetical protein
MKFLHQSFVFSVLFVQLLVTLLITGCQLAEPSAEQKLDNDFQRMLNWFPGEYDNKSQVASLKAASPDGKSSHEQIHHIFMPVQAPAIGAQVIFVKQYMNDDYENVYRQRLYVLDKEPASQSIKLTIYSYLDEKKYRYVDKNPALIASIKPDELLTIPGCEVYWTYSEADAFFTGKMLPGACTFQSKRSGKTITISDTLRLTEREIWIADKAVDQEGNWVFGNKDGVPHKNVKTKSLFNP